MCKEYFFCNSRKYYFSGMIDFCCNNCRYAVIDHSGSSADQAGKVSVSQILETLEYGPAPESPAVANAWLDDHGRSFGHFINNQWVKPSGRKTYDSVNPATGEKLATTVQGKMCKVL